MGGVEGEKAERLLEHVRRHEKHVQVQLGEYDPEEAKAVLDGWIQFVPTQALEKALEEATFESGMSADEVVERTLEVDRELIGIYRQLAGSLTAPRSQEFFTSLAQLEEVKSSEIARGAEEHERLGA